MDKDFDYKNLTPGNLVIMPPDYKDKYIKLQEKYIKLADKYNSLVDKYLDEKGV